MEFAGGGDWGRVLAGCCAQADTSTGAGTSMAGSNATGAAKSIGTFADRGWTAAFQVVTVGASFWQQPTEAGIAMFPHWRFTRLQQARSAGLRCALGREQAIAGASSGSTTASISANWRRAFTAAFILHWLRKMLNIGAFKRNLTVMHSRIQQYATESCKNLHPRMALG